MQIVNDKFIENVEQCMHKLQMDCLKDVGLKLSRFCYTVCNQDNVAQVINVIMVRNEYMIFFTLSAQGLMFSHLVGF